MLCCSEDCTEAGLDVTMIYTAAVVIRKNKSHFDLSIVSRYEMTVIMLKRHSVLHIMVRQEECNKYTLPNCVMANAGSTGFRAWSFKNRGVPTFSLVWPNTRKLDGELRAKSTYILYNFLWLRCKIVPGSIILKFYKLPALQVSLLLCSHYDQNKWKVAILPHK